MPWKLDSAASQKWWKDDKKETKVYVKMKVNKDMFMDRRPIFVASNNPCGPQKKKTIHP